MYGIRAMEWFEGSRDWREFYRLKQGFGPGTATYTALMNDPEIARELAVQRRAARKSDKSGRPRVPAEGFDRYVSEFTDLKDMIAAVASSFGGGTPTFSPRPRYLVDDIEEQISRQKSRSLIAELIPDESAR